MFNGVILVFGHGVVFWNPPWMLHPSSLQR